MSTTFISHRMFVAALNHDPSAPEPVANHATPAHSSAAPTRPANQLTVEQLAAFASRYWPDFPFMRGLEQSVS